MKALIFLTVLALIVGAVIWWLRKSQAEAVLAQRKAVERRKQKDQESLTPEIDMIWPVVVKPVTGEEAPTEENAAEELQMSTIEFESSEQSKAQ